MPEAARPRSLDRAASSCRRLAHRELHLSAAMPTRSPPPAARPMRSLTDYVPFDSAVLGQLARCRIISVAATGWDCVDVARRRRARHPGRGRRRILHGRGRGPHARADAGASSAAFAPTTARSRARMTGAGTRCAAFGAFPASRSGSSASGASARRFAAARGASALPCSPRIRAWTPPWCAATAPSRRHSTISSRAPTSSRLHCNLDAGSRGLLDRRAFAAMQRKPLLINVARGALVVEADLAEALDRGLLRGAALDVLAEDSPDLGHHPLIGRDDVLLTPHVAFYSETALDDLRRISAANITRVPRRPARTAVFRLGPGAGGRVMSERGRIRRRPGARHHQFQRRPALRRPAAAEAAGLRRRAVFRRRGAVRPQLRRSARATRAFAPRSPRSSAVPREPVDPDSLMLTGGISQALDFVCGQVSRGPATSVFVEEPSYPYSFQIFRDHGLEDRGRAAGRRRHGPRPLRTAARASAARSCVYTIPVVSQPDRPGDRRASGATASSRLAREHDFIIAADEVYQLLLPRRPAAAVVRHAGGAGNVLSLGTFSKILAPGLRLGWIQATARPHEDGCSRAARW